MKYSLYSAVDTRDDKPVLWLHDYAKNRVALFHVKTAPSRIKHLTAVAPEGITWEHRNTWLTHASVAGAAHLGDWEMNS